MPRYYVDLPWWRRLGSKPSRARTRALSSAGSGKRPSCFCEKSSSPASRTSKTPPRPGTSVTPARLPSRPARSSWASQTARPRKLQTVQYSIERTGFGGIALHVERARRSCQRRRRAIGIDRTLNGAAWAPVRPFARLRWMAPSDAQAAGVQAAVAGRRAALAGAVGRSPGGVSRAAGRAIGRRRARGGVRRSCCRCCALRYNDVRQAIRAAPDSGARCMLGDRDELVGPTGSR